MSSRGTYKNDFEWKKSLYVTTLKVKEYYIYDPEGLIYPNFVGFQLIDGNYDEIDFVESRLRSDVLGLELGERDGVLHFFDPLKQQWLQPPLERLESVETRAKIAESEV